MDVNSFTHRAAEALASAQREARSNDHQRIEPEHLLVALLADPDGVVFPVVRRAGADPGMLKARAAEALDRILKVYGPEQETVASQLGRLIERARKEAAALGDQYVSTEHLLLALTEGLTAAAKLLTGAGVTREAILAALNEVRVGRGSVTDQTLEAKYQALERFGRDLTQMAREGKLDPVIGRDDEVRRVVQVLSRRTKNNPVLIGEPGVGKIAIVEGLAGRIVAGDVPESLKDKRIVALDLGAMVAGSKFRASSRSGLKAVLDDIRGSDGQIITFIDRPPHGGRAAGAAEGLMDAGNMLKPMLARGELRMVGATTLDEYRKHIEKDAALERRFQPVLVGEPSVQDTIAILRGLKERYEVHHGVRIQDSALVAAAALGPLRHRPVPARQGHRPGRRGRSRLRIEIDSMPTEVDVLERRARQLEIERAALKKEKDEASRSGWPSSRRPAGLQETLTAMKSHWEGEKEAIGRIREINAASRRSGARPSGPPATAPWSGRPS